jgi:hypothetical protein
MTKGKKDDDIAESQKLSDRDKKEIGEGACVNCALALLVFALIAVVAFVL